jgi:hypothetical protein
MNICCTALLRPEWRWAMSEKIRTQHLERKAILYVRLVFPLPGNP